MIKYATDGIHNDYNFVGRIQYEEMYDKSEVVTVESMQALDLDIDKEQTEEDMIEKYEENLIYEIIVYANSNTKGMVIYKSVIPSIFSIGTEIKLTNLKRTITIPSLVLKSKCHFQCEKWNEEDDYYGFIKIKAAENMVINKDSIITALE